MFVTPITNKYNQPNFQAMMLKRKNPNVTDEIRFLAEKATNLIENINGKRIDADGVSIGLPINEKHRFNLSKVIDNKNICLSLNKDFFARGTEISLCITGPRNKYINRIRYESHGMYKNPDKHGHLYVWGEFFASDRCDKKYGIKIDEKRKPYSNDEAKKIFVKYVSELLNADKKIAELFK